MLGLKRGTVKLAEHDSKWEKAFKREANIIKKILGRTMLSVWHVGSTSIPGMSAKPIIDIGVIVSSLEEVKGCIPELEKASYKLKQNDPKTERLFFTKGPEKKRTHYIHIGEKGSDYIEDMILFRNYLRQNLEVAKKYSNLKRQLANDHSEDRNIYTKEKEEFIKNILKKARKKEIIEKVAKMLNKPKK